jgi:hypothetical protein
MGPVTWPDPLAFTPTSQYSPVPATFVRLPFFPQTHRHQQERHRRLATKSTVASYSHLVLFKIKARPNSFILTFSPPSTHLILPPTPNLPRDRRMYASNMVPTWPHVPPPPGQPAAGYSTSYSSKSTSADFGFVHVVTVSLTC